MPGRFAIPAPDVDMWTALGVPADVLADRSGEWLSIVGRLHPGVDLRRAQEDLTATAAQLAADFPKTNAGERALIRTLLDESVGSVRRPLWLGGAAALFVLLAGCANAANLLIARATMRRDEIAIRAALGAEPFRLARQLLVESLVLAACGGLCGIAAATPFLAGFAALADGRVPRIDQLQLSAAAAAVAVAGSIAAALLSGGAAALRLVRDASRHRRSTLARSTRGAAVGSGLVAVQVAFAMVLVTAAAVVTRSYLHTVRIDPGFDTRDTLTLQLTLAKSAYPDNAAHIRFAERVHDTLTGIPGVATAGIVSDLPFVGNAPHLPVRREGAPASSAEPMTIRLADPGFFEVARLPLQRGRRFERSDRIGAPSVAIVNRTAAARLPVDALRLQIDGEGPRTIVGVVGDIKHGGLYADEGPVVYVPYAQKSFAFFNWMGIVVRGAGSVPAVPAIRAGIASVDPRQPAFDVRSMDDYLRREAAPFQFGALVVGSLAGCALLLSITGVYGLTAFLVGRRRREIGVRMALGATPGAIVRLVLGRMLVVIAVGTLIGAAGSAAAGRLLHATLADAGGGAVLPMAIAGSSFLIAAMLAAAMPAMRAARIYPRRALQAD
jgi:putative ABC transport system permease protein